MGKGLKIAVIAVAVIVVLCFGAYRFFAGTYNKMVSSEENVKSAWSQVENVYQRRLDLIPNLVQAVKGYASHEAKVLRTLQKPAQRPAVPYRFRTMF